MHINDNINILKNIGEKRQKALNDMGIFTVADIVEYFPRDYQDRSVITPLKDCCQDCIYTIKARIIGKFETMSMKKTTVSRVKASDGTGEIYLVWFNQPYMKSVLDAAKEYAFTGNVSERAGHLQMQSPDYEAVTDKELINSGRIIPVYSSAARLSQKNLRGFVKDALDLLSDGLKDFLPEEIRSKNDICQRDYAIKNIHFPENGQAFFAARKRLVFEELFLMQLTLYKIKGEIQKQEGVVLPKNNKNQLLASLPFQMTNAQKKVLSEIENDMSSGFVMNRLVQGDVGCGKTAVAMAAAFGAISHGYQASLMAPTEVLANQHYLSIRKIFEPFGIKTVILSGSLSKKDRQKVYREIETGAAQMVIGTHALIEEGVRFNNVVLAITDEQHRFGVLQRGKLSAKGNLATHVLVMSATPIPRTLALILYGDMDISIIDELPPGREKVDTYAVNSAYRDRIYDFIKEEINNGRQVYIICPMIEETEALELKSVLNYSKEIEKQFQRYSVACLHGKMKNSLKQGVMDGFAKGEINILVSTTVIEVGINVPNATVMFIENAERFGLSQLHQLRGRVGRGAEKSYCVLLSDSKSKITSQRMKAMQSTCDGFKISEMDLQLRGPGDYFGTRQHGLPEFKIANLYRDMEILKAAQKTADDIIRDGFLSSNEDYAGLNIKLAECLKKIQKLSL